MLKRKFWKQFVPMLLCVAMLIGELPVNALAAEDAQAGGIVATEDSITADTATPPDILPAAIITVNEERLAEKIEELQYLFDYSVNAVVVGYIGEDCDDYDSYAAKMTDLAKYAISVERAGTSVDLKDVNDPKMVYKWQQLGEDGNYAEMAVGQTPRKVGMYRLVVSREAEDKVCGAAAPVVALNLKIEPAELTLGVPQTNFSAGITAGEVVRANPYEKITLIRSDLKDDYGNESYDKPELFFSSLTVEVQDAADTVIESGKRLQMDQNYYLVLKPVFHDKELETNYRVKQSAFRIQLGSKTATRIEVSYVDPSKPIARDYDGKPVDVKSLVEAAIARVRVLYTDTDGTVKELEDVKPGAEWCDAAKHPYEDKSFVPTNAGIYFYHYFYRDESGTCADADEYVKVQIRMVDIVVKPVFGEGFGDKPAESPEVYEGVSVKNLLKKVECAVEAIAEGASAPETDAYFWGVYSNAGLAGTTQYYQPVFAVQRGEESRDAKGVVTVSWQTITDPNYRLALGERYRVVFSGEKAVFNSDGTYYARVDVNDAMKNYAVDTTDAAIDKYAKELTVKEAVKVKINVDKILQAGKGATFAAPITKEYDGRGWYEDKGKYKLATVATVSENSAQLPADIDKTLIYTWQKYRSGGAWETTTDKDGNRVDSVREDAWIEAGPFNDVETLSAPMYRGVYRLKIELGEPSGEFAGDPAYVYYVIQPRTSLVKIGGTPAVYEDNVTTVGDFIAKLQNWDSADTATYIDPQFLYATLTEGLNGAVTLTTDKAIDDSEGYVSDIISNMFERPSEYFRVERNGAVGESKGAWRLCSSDEVFRENIDYRLSVVPRRIEQLSSDEESFSRNHNFGLKWDVYGHAILEEDYYYAEGAVAVKVNKTKGGAVTIALDSSKLTETVRTYDGKPIDLTEVKNLVTVKDADGTDIKNKVDIVYSFRDDVYGGRELAESGAYHAGQYTLFIRTKTNADYLGSELNAASFTIKKRDYVITPELRDIIYAGTACDSKAYLSVLAEPYDLENSCDFKGAVGNETVGRLYSYSAFKIYEKYSAVALSANDRLKGNQDYYVKVDDYYFDFDWEKDRDYALKLMPAAFTARPMAADVAQEDVRLAHTYEFKDGAYVHSITATAGVSVPFYSTLKDMGNKALASGNYLQFRIYAPADYQYSGKTFEELHFVYENELRKADGILMASGYDWEKELPYITVAFSVAQTEKTPEFVIVWEKGGEKSYSEKYMVSLEDLTLQADYTQAVAPSKLAFVTKKITMAVGETLQLDVKVTKKQRSDIIYLGYSTNSKNITVNDSGFVTALSSGGAAATVTVYPCRIVDGKKVRIEGKGVKTATATITVKNVTAPSGLKVKYADTYADVTYKKPANGSRREIYVMEGKQKASDFTKALAKVQNADYKSEFAVEPVFMTTEQTDSAGKVTQRIYDLKPSTTYTVFVRNVSGLRTLENGGEVAVASAVAASRSFSTILPQMTSMRLPDGTYYEVPMSEKTLQLKVEGRFPQRYLQNYSDQDDYIWRELPLGKDQATNRDLKQVYTAPRLSYYVHNGNPTYGTQKESGSILYFNNYNYWPTTIATVDKNGKVTFKGRGTVRVLIVDNNTGMSRSATIDITASETKVTGKNVTLQVGETVRLSDCLVYYEGNNTNKLYWNQYTGGRLTVEESPDEYFDIRRDDNGKDYFITARMYKSGKTLTLHVEDSNVKAANGDGTTVKVSVKAMAQPKNIKKTSVRDNKFTVEFSYPYPAWNFRAELKNANDGVVSSQIVQPTIVGYDAKKNLYRYSYTFQGQGIRRHTTYSVKIEAVYEDPATKKVTFSKPAALKKLTTTNTPVSYTELAADQFNTGERVVVTAQKSGATQVLLSQMPVFKTGNSYTLRLDSGDNLDEARDRMSDSVVWKSKNKNIATIRALSGTYSATLKAVKSGQTVIELSSKITGKVIARYNIYIAAVGDADDYFGEYEPYAALQIHSANSRDVLEFSESNPITVTLNAMEAQWFVFEAPAYGNYSVDIARTDKNTGVFAYYLDSMSQVDEKGNVSFELSHSNLYTMNAVEKGKKLYVYLPASEKMTVRVRATVQKRYQDVVLGDNKVKGGRNIRFIAPEDNYYTFSLVDGENVSDLGSRSLENGDPALFDEIGIVDGKEYIVRVQMRVPEDISSKVDGDVAVSIGREKEKWYVFTAPEANLYTFYTVQATKQLKLEQFDGLNEAAAAREAVGKPLDVSTGDMELAMEANEKVYLRMSAEDATAEAPVTATLKIVKNYSVKKLLKLDESAEVSFVKDTPVWYTFQATQTGLYNVFCNLTAGSVTSMRFSATLSGADPEYITAGREIYLEKDQTIYLMITADTDTKAELTITTRQYKGSLTANADPVKVPAIEAKGEVWYRFVADEYNYYNFIVSDIKKNAIVTLYNSLESREARKDGGSKLESTAAAFNNIPLRKHETVYVRIAALDAKEDTLKLKVTKLVPEEIGLNTAKENPFAAANEEKWYIFTPDETNYYTFYYNFSAAGADVTFCDRIVGGTSSYSQYWSGRNLTEQKLEAGKTIYIRISASGATNMSLKIRKRALEGTLKVGANDKITLTQNEAKWYKVEANDENYYTFNVTATESTKMELYRDILDPTSYQDYSDIKTENPEIAFAEAGAVFVKLVTAKTTSDVTIKISDRKLVGELKFGTAAELTLSNADGKREKWYTFTAPATNTYTFYSEDVQGKFGAGIYERMSQKDANDYVESNGAKIKLADITIEKDKTVYLRFSHLGTDPMRGEIKIANRMPSPITMDSEDDNKEIFRNDGEKWYEFQAPAEGYYTFYAYTDKLANVARFTAYNSYIITSTPVGSFDSNDFMSSDYKLTANKKLYLKVVVDGASVNNPVTVCLKIRKRESDTASTLAVDVDNDITLRWKQDQWFKFTPTEANYYMFSCDTDNVVVRRYATMNDDTGIPALGNGLSMQANQTVYLRIHSTALTKTDLTATDPTVAVKLRVKGRVISNTPLHDGDTITLSSSNNEAWYKFEADADNCYTFYSDTVTNGDITLACYTSLADNSPKTSDTSASHTQVGAYKRVELSEVAMKNGNICYLKFSLYNSSAATAVFKVRKRAPITAIPSAGQDVTLTQADKEHWYSFTADVDPAQYYTVCLEDVTKGDIVVESYLSIDSTELNSSVTTTSALQDNISLPECYLANGKTIYVKLKLKGSDATAECKLKIRKRELEVDDLSNDINLADNSTNQIELAPGDIKYYKFTPAAAGRYYFKYTGADTSVRIRVYDSIAPAPGVKPLTERKGLDAKTDPLYVAAGGTLVVRLETASAYSETFTFELVSNAFTFTTADDVCKAFETSREQKRETTEAGATTVVWYKFKAPATAKYNFVLRGVGENGSHKLERFETNAALAGPTADGFTLSVIEDNVTVSTGDIQLTADAEVILRFTANATDAVLDSYISIQATYENVVKTNGDQIDFTAPEDGRYYFWSSDSNTTSNPSGTLYYVDKNGKESATSAALTRPDYWEFLIQLNLTKGTKVRLKLSLPGTTGNARVRITNYEPKNQ